MNIFKQLPSLYNICIVEQRINSGLSLPISIYTKVKIKKYNKRSEQDKISMNNNMKNITVHIRVYI